MWSNLKSTMGNEIARAKREKELLNAKQDNVPMNCFGQKSRNDTKHTTSRAVTRTGVSAAQFISSVSEKSEPVVAFKPIGKRVEDEGSSVEKESKEVSHQVTTTGFMEGWGF